MSIKNLQKILDRFNVSVDTAYLKPTKFMTAKREYIFVDIVPVGRNYRFQIAGKPSFLRRRI